MIPSMRRPVSAENDRVDPTTIVLPNATTGEPKDRQIYWRPPEDPNGIILGYRAKLYAKDKVMVSCGPLCVPQQQFRRRWSCA